MSKAGEVSVSAAYVQMCRPKRSPTRVPLQTVFWPRAASDKDRAGQVTVASTLHGAFKLEGFGGEPTAGPVQPLWQLSLRDGERLSRRSTPNAASAVASLGKVTGDRSVMYKCASSVRRHERR